jgi:MFS family permease
MCFHSSVANDHSGAPLPNRIYRALGRFPAVTLFAHPVYRLLFGVSAIGSFGFWFQATMLTWVVYEMTGSAAQVGLIALFQWGPYAILGLFSVGLADVFSRRTILLTCQVGYALSASLLAVLALTDHLGIGAIFATCAWRSLLMCVEQPARQVMIPSIVAPTDLTKVFGMTAAIGGLARVVAPAVAGGLIAGVGVKFCFIPNMLTATINILGLFLLTRSLPPFERRSFRPIDALIEGLKIVVRQREVLVLMIVLFCVTTLPLSFQVILPVFSDEWLDGRPTTFGTLISCMGLGAVVGSFIITSTRNMTAMHTLGCALGIGLVQAGFLIQANILTSAVLMFIAGACAVGLIVGTNAVILAETDKSAHGRVGGLYSYLVNAIGPLGSVVTGWIVAQGGSRLAFAIGSAICLVSAGGAILVLYRRSGPDRHCGDVGRE